LAITILTGGNTLPMPHPLDAYGVLPLDPQSIFHNSHTDCRLYVRLLGPSTVLKLGRLLDADIQGS